MPLVITPQDVQAYAPDAPAVTSEQVQEARDWAEPLIEAAGLTLTPDSRQERAALRAVMAYAVSLAVGGQVTAGALDTRRLVKLKDGAEELTFDARDTATVAALPDLWRRRAYVHLYEAGVPRPGHAVGASL